MAKLKWYHGEVYGESIDSLPQGVTEKKIVDNHYVVGDSETHGNDHRVAVLDKTDVKFYEKDGVLYMVNTAATDVFCPKEGRHDTRSIPPNIWKINKAKEFDHLKQEKRDVRD